ncbi:MAG: hypothetical protein JWO08_2381 [Verrucomicrobiaceae bacterium]|nr:hypothetical protein [Verrucomicrobiaceae bacterium]
MIGGHDTRDFPRETVFSCSTQEVNDKQPKSSRNCPALSKTITPKECGSDRVSKLDCPNSCEFHPFTAGNANGLAELEQRVFKKTQKRVLDELGGEPARELGRALREAEDEVSHFLMLTQAVHKAGDKEGPDFVERWQKAGFEGVNNDERTLLQAQRTQRPALLQIKKVLDQQSMEVTDLLESEPTTFTVVADVELDPVMEGDSLLAWIYDAPLFTRLSGPAFELPENESGNPLEALAEIARKLDGPMIPGQLGLWLRSHMLEVYEALVEANADEGDEEDGALMGVDDMIESFDWSELPDFSHDRIPRQKVINEQAIEDRLAPFLHRYQEDAEDAVQWFEQTWQDIASGVDQLTEGVLSDEGFGVVLILLAKGAAVLHARPPVREGADPLRFIWQLGNELRDSSKIEEEEDFERYVQNSPQPVVAEWLCGEAASFAEGDEAVFSNENLAVVFPVVKAAIWEMCHWYPL